jgi:hypothetical protein
VCPVTYELNVIRPALFKCTPITSTKSFQAPNANSSSLSDMFQSSHNAISAEHDRAQWGRVRRRQNNGLHKKLLLEIVNENGCATATRPVVRDGAPHRQIRNCLTVTAGA